METFRVTSVLLFFLVGAVVSFPSRPLNERSTELAWQAWLLVDDQNQNRQNDPDGALRRRITPKSIFIAPTFSPETLPACAEGYRSDSMGRCINIIQIDADAHLNFLLQKLNEKFGKPSEFDEDTSQENTPTTGPFQFNIPLDSEDDEEDTSKEDVDVAIVVAPTNGNFDTENDSVKVNVKRTNNRTGDSGSKNVGEMTTTEVDDNTDSSSEPALTTTTESYGETTEMTTPIGEQTTQNLYFWEPLETLLKTEHVQNGTNNTKGDTPNKRDSVEPMVTTTMLEDDDLFTTTTLSSPVRFPTDPPKPPTSQTITYQQRPNNYQIVMEDSSQGSLALDPQPQSQYGSPNAHHVYNHRNRDKHTSLWFRPSSLQKQLLLKVPRKTSSSGPYQHHQRDSYHRELQPEEISYIFGNGHRRRNLR